MGLVVAVKELARTGELQRNHYTNEQKGRRRQWLGQERFVSVQLHEEARNGIPE